jgi:hypothetical protein
LNFVIFLQISDCQTNTKTQNTGVFSIKRTVGESDAILQRVVVKLFPILHLAGKDWQRKTATHLSPTYCAHKHKSKAISTPPSRQFVNNSQDTINQQHNTKGRIKEQTEIKKSGGMWGNVGEID